ncbi:MAG: DUF3794 domain-containing protein [Ruminococcus sp.]|nr:DUF3794 domain-containing protein [Ruminococcus sp.]
MEYNFSKHTVSYPDSFLDTVNEQIVDVDVTLPDYCPDIEKILKCTLIPKVHTRVVLGGQLTIDGVSLVRILYCDSIRHNIRSFTQTVPFSANFSLKSTPEQYIVLCDTKCEYINCRALSPRKLVIHGAFSLSAKVVSKEQTGFYSFDEECDLQVKSRDITVSDLCAICQEQFSVNEDITVSNKPPVESLLSYSVSAVITDLKSIHNKVMLNAEITLKAMYIADIDSGETEHLNYVFPINRVIDCDGVTDETVSVPLLEVMSYDLHLKNDQMSDGTLLLLDVKLCFSEMGFLPKTLSLIDDAYSTVYITEHKREMLKCESHHSCESFTHILKSTVKLDSVEISKVLDVYCESVNASPIVSDGVLSLNGKTSVCMLLKDKDNVPVYVERSVEIDCKPQLNRTFDHAQLCNCFVNSVSYRLSDASTLELRIELKATMLLSDSVIANPVIEVMTLEEKPVACDDCSLILYFADKGEDTWDIAKMYRTKESLLKSENALEDNVLQSAQMLLVPTE